jgi:hypothetical protein
MYCYDACGDFLELTLTATTIYTDVTKLNCETFEDCRVTGCNHGCDDGAGAGHCPCAANFLGISMNSVRSFVHTVWDLLLDQLLDQLLCS